MVHFNLTKYFTAALLMLAMLFVLWDRPAAAAPSGPDRMSASVSEATYSSSTKLQSISTSPSLSLPFSPSQTRYSVEVPFSTDRITFWATAADSQARITVNGNRMSIDGYQVSLSVGSNTIVLDVEAPNSQPTRYTIQITRLDGSSDDALGSLSFSSGRLYPSFQPDTTEYTLYVDYPIQYIYTTAYVRDTGKATLQVNGKSFPDGTTIVNKKPMETGQTSLVISVTAQNGNIQPYYITIKRAGPTSTTVPSGSSGSFDIQPIAKANTDRLVEPFGIKKVQIELALSPYKSAIQAKGSEAVTVDGTANQLRPLLEIKVLPELWKAAGDYGKTLLVQTNELDIALKPNVLPQTAEDAAVVLTVKPADLTLRSEWNVKPTSTSRDIAAFELSLESVGKDTARWNRPITAAFKLNPHSIRQASKLGAYRYDEASRSWTFLGGELKTGNRFEFRTDAMGLFGVFEEDQAYLDIRGHWAEPIIAIMTTKKIAGGVGEGRFSPDEPITRAEFVSMLSRAMDLQQSAAVSFPDVPGDAWYRYDLAKALSAGLIEGSDSGSFLPQATITREQMAVMIMRAYSLKMSIRQQDILFPAGAKFTDEDTIAAWAYRSIRLSDAVGLMNGSPDGAFHAQATATRAEALVVLYRLLNKTMPS
ncbi:S-layer homology domain-containing protein [Paenibacillus filicis]|uniref:S-layer homology domain-containing protein n=1 Tax=Paenibacillus filicis TaxID=669464 RepID=A0ABU9DQP5_9BACL